MSNAARFIPSSRFFVVGAVVALGASALAAGCGRSGPLVETDDVIVENCGNAVCESDGGESCETCPIDCGFCAGCGDGFVRGHRDVLELPGRLRRLRHVRQRRLRRGPRAAAPASRTAVSARRCGDGSCCDASRAAPAARSTAASATPAATARATPPRPARAARATAASATSAATASARPPKTASQLRARLRRSASRAATASATRTNENCFSMPRGLRRLPRLRRRPVPEHRDVRLVPARLRRVLGVPEQRLRGLRDVLDLPAGLRNSVSRSAASRS
jgi:hypothetical protein